MLIIQTFTFNAFQENTYLITNETGECWIVDPGMNDINETKLFFEYIASHNLIPRSIINTHTHLDHIFGVRACVDKFAIPFLIHEKDVPVLAGANVSAAMFGFPPLNVPAPSGFIREDEQLKLGQDTVEVRFTPGHSPGSISFYFPAGEWVIAGDVLFNRSIGRTDLPGGDYDTLISSIEKELFTLPGSTKVFAGHGPSTTVGEEIRMNPFLKK